MKNISVSLMFFKNFNLSIWTRIPKVKQIFTDSLVAVTEIPMKSVFG